MKPFPSPTYNTRINTRMSHDHRTIHTSVYTVLYDQYGSYDRHTTNTVQVRIIHGQVRPDTVSTSVQSSCMIIQHSNTTENITTCWHLETTEYLLHNDSKEEGPQKNPHHGRFSQENTKRAFYQSYHDFLFPYSVICHFYIYSVQNSKIYEAKPSKWVNLYQNIH